MDIMVHISSNVFYWIVHYFIWRMYDLCKHKSRVSRSSKSVNICAFFLSIFFYKSRT